MGCAVGPRRAGGHDRGGDFSAVARAHNRPCLGLVHLVSWIGMLRLASHDHGEDSIGHLRAFRRGNEHDSLRCSHGTLLGGVLDCLFLWLVQTSGRRRARHNRAITGADFTVPAKRIVSPTQEAVTITTCPRGRRPRRTSPFEEDRPSQALSASPAVCEPQLHESAT